MNIIKHIFSTIWNTWKKFGQFMGDMIGRLFLMIFYYTIVLPFGLGTRLFSDPLDMQKGKPAAWHERNPAPVSIEASREQS